MHNTTILIVLRTFTSVIGGKLQIFEGGVDRSLRSRPTRVLGLEDRWPESRQGG